MDINDVAAQVDPGKAQLAVARPFQTDSRRSWARTRMTTPPSTSGGTSPDSHQPRGLCVRTVNSGWSNSIPLWRSDIG